MLSSASRYAGRGDCPIKRCPPVHLTSRGRRCGECAGQRGAGGRLREAGGGREKPGETKKNPGAAEYGSRWKDALCLLQFQLQYAFFDLNLYVLYKPVIIDVLLF